MTNRDAARVTAAICYLEEHWQAQPELDELAAAVANNPIACLIPCHRLIRATGTFGDYR